MRQTKLEYLGNDTFMPRPTYVTMASITMSSRLRSARILFYDALKRGFGLIVPLVSLVILSPLFAIVAIAIKIDSPGPVFFRQKRTGKNGKVFEIMKFRSMVADNDVQDASCEDKYTKVGKILRKTSIDELPQLINVLKGEMAFVGPRPWVPEYYENMNELERRRNNVRPGITGLAAVNGRNGLDVFEKIGYDLDYVENYSLKQDVKILVMTVRQLFKREEVNAGKEQIHNDIRDLKRENQVT